VLLAWNERLNEEVQTLRALIKSLPLAALARSWAILAGNAPNLAPEVNTQRREEDHDCVTISVQRSYLDT
jgi:hypothetical protein